jgi:SAM-dependent methyltransferase
VHEGDATSTDETQEYRQRTYLNWQRAASGWDRQRGFVGRSTRPATEWLVDHLSPTRGDTILELGAGPGDTSLELAELVSPGGRVLCTDLSPNMVAAAEREARDRGLDAMECRVVDAEALDLPDASVDAAVCRFVLMLMPEPALVLGELRRVLRHGGRLGVVVWGEPDRNPWATALWDVIERHIETPPAARGGPGMFAFADSDRLGEVIRDAGFEVRRIERIPVVWGYPSFDHYWQVQTELNGALTALVSTLEPERLEALRAAVAEAVSEFGTPARGYRLPGEALGALAVVPSPG